MPASETIFGFDVRLRFGTVLYAGTVRRREQFEPHVGVEIVRFAGHGASH